MKPITRTRRPIRLLALAASLSLAIPAITAADPDYSRDRGYRWGSGTHSVIDGDVVDVQVRVDGGTAPLFFKPGASDRHYFQAFRGRNYSLVLRNTTDRRIGVLISVDGLNVVNGERSSLTATRGKLVTWGCGGGRRHSPTSRATSPGCGRTWRSSRGAGALWRAPSRAPSSR